MFEERYNETPAYIMIGNESLTILKADYETIVAYDGGPSEELKFMGIELIPTDRIEGTYLVKKEG